jgi:hypothetical protein
MARLATLVSMLPTVATNASCCNQNNYAHA